MFNANAASEKIKLERRRSLLDSFYSFRNRLLASPRFQRWAAAFPLTRPLARRRARELFDLCAGFVYSQVLQACVQLDLFQFLAEEPKTLAGIARHCQLDEEASRRLLDAAVALHLIERRGGQRYGLGIHGAALLGNPGVIAMIKHHTMLYQDLTDPVALLKGEKEDCLLNQYWHYTEEKNVTGEATQKVSPYSALMSASQPLVAEQILDGYSLKAHHCLLDVGGGDGTFLMTVARRYPHLQLMHFDLPAVAEKARQNFSDAGLGDRVTVHPGSFLTDALPKGADVISLVRIIHDHDDDVALTILRAAYTALPEGGRLILAEPMSGIAGTEPMADAYFGFYLLAMGRGRPRTVSRLGELLSQTGFSGYRTLPTRIPLQTSLLIASK